MPGFPLIIQPDDEEPGAAEILVEGRVGERSYTFLLDTGAGTSSVALDEYTAAFPSGGQHSSAGVFAASSADLISVPVLQLGPITRTDFTLTRSAGERRSLIGMDLLKDACLHFLFSEERVEVDPPLEGMAPLHELIVGKKYHPYVEVQFGEQSARAVWDTGAGLTVVDLGWIRQRPEYFQEDGQSVGTDSAGASLDTPMYRMSGCQIGGYQFPAQRVAGVDLAHVNASTEIAMDLILGYNTLRSADWLFDFPRRRWGITKLNDPAE